MQETLTQLLQQIRSCRHRADHPPCGPRPILQAGRSAQLRIIAKRRGERSTMLAFRGLIHPATGCVTGVSSSSRLRGMSRGCWGLVVE
jgi:hypothetical protein